MMRPFNLNLFTVTALLGALSGVSASASASEELWLTDNFFTVSDSTISVTEKDGAYTGRVRVVTT